MGPAGNRNARFILYQSCRLIYEGLCFNHNSVKILRNIQETSVDGLIESSDWVLPSGH